MFMFELLLPVQRQGSMVSALVSGTSFKSRAQIRSTQADV